MMQRELRFEVTVPDNVHDEAVQDTFDRAILMAKTRFR